MVTKRGKWDLCRVHRLGRVEVGVRLRRGKRKIGGFERTNEGALHPTKNKIGIGR